MNEEAMADETVGNTSKRDSAFDAWADEQGPHPSRVGEGDHHGGRPWAWLESTVELQRVAYGFDPRAIPDEGGRSDFIKENVLAAMDELMELLHEVSWKYWAHDAPFVNRDRVLKEAVDVAHFLGNILAAIDVTDEEWEAAYQEKQAENLRRQREGYEVRNK